MLSKNVFLSVGGTANNQQENFVKALEDRLRAEGLVPKTVGRNTFSSDAPLVTVERLMDTCVGTVVVALERSYFEKGLDKRGGKQEVVLGATRLATPWNQIEATMSYCRGLPILVIVENGLKSEGLLERGYDWYVQSVPLVSGSLNTPEFNGVLADWKEKLKNETPNKNTKEAASFDVENLTMGQIFGALHPKQFWSLLVTFGTLIAAAFALGAKLFS